MNLHSSGLLQQLRELLLLGLEVGVAADVLFCNEDVGDRSLRCDFVEGVLDGRAIVLMQLVCDGLGILKCRLTDLVELDGVELRALLAQERLGGLAVRAVGFAEDSCDVCQLMGSHHG